MENKDTCDCMNSQDINTIYRILIIHLFACWHPFKFFNFCTLKLALWRPNAQIHTQVASKAAGGHRRFGGVVTIQTGGFCGAGFVFVCDCVCRWGCDGAVWRVWGWRERVVVQDEWSSSQSDTAEQPLSHRWVASQAPVLHLHLKWRNKKYFKKNCIRRNSESVIQTPGKENSYRSTHFHRSRYDLGICCIVGCFKCALYIYIKKKI